MVGVPKSTGCLTCRKRKIKCDETWPICFNCRKNGKLCPGPPARHTFRDLGPQLDVKGRNGNMNKCAASVDQTHQMIHPTHLKKRWADTGAVVLKFRVSRTYSEQQSIRQCSRSRSTTTNLSIQPTSTPYNLLPTSANDGLAQALVKAMEADEIGYSVSAFGSFMHEVPRRVGHNPALDAAVACLIHARSALLSTNNFNDADSPKYYLDAVQRLQGCLEDPLHGMTSNTLCAAVILSLVEALSGPRIDNSYLAHVGGAGRLLEIQGPESCGDDFAKEILRFTRGGVIVSSIYRTEPCFLLAPEWRNIAFDNTGASVEESLYTDVLHLMATLSALLKDLRELNMTSTPIVLRTDGLHYEKVFDSTSLRFPNLNAILEAPCTDFDVGPLQHLNPHHEYPMEFPRQGPTKQHLIPSHPLLEKVCALRSSLHTTGVQLSSHLTDGSFALEIPSVEPNNPLPTTYRFRHWRTARIYTIHWSLTILVNKTLLKLLPPHDPSVNALEAECRTVALEICKTWENAWANRPIGACHVWLGFVVAYECCSKEVQKWVLEALNMLLEDQRVEHWRWTEDLVGVMNRKLKGEGDGLVATEVR